MAGQTYQVNYIVNVDAANAQTAINSFKRAVASMDKATRPIMDLQAKVRGLVETMSALSRGNYVVRIDTKQATQKIGKLIRALQMAKAEVQQLNAMGVTLGGVGGKKSATSRTSVVASPIGGSSSRATRARATATSSSRATVAPGRSYSSTMMRYPTNLGYKLWGPTPLPNNGGMAIDMLKGMGIAYGLAGAGMLVSKVVDQAVEYDNLMKTVENILKSHDTRGDFSRRFGAMTSTVRNVGMETKFTVTEVADAAKFLAMAGLDVEYISQAIRPIADIALIGDTDLGKTADLVTNIMTAYNIAPHRMRDAADIMTNTFTMSNTTLTEIAESYKYAASLLSAADVSFEEATAAIGVLGDAGIKGSQAGTTLRTIMANLANPTKKQRAGWEAIGISLTDKDGNRKDPLKIFQELNEKDLDVKSFYQIFHKTAASGAVALASHVDKWENVYLENFLSRGLSANLADEKKNTLQGLWAQVESVFVDKGVTAFDGIQGQLKHMMKAAISWLQTDQATKAFKEVSNVLMEFVHILIDASKWFVKFYELFGPMIKAWMKFQLMIWPVVKAVTALRSVFLSLMGLRKIGFFISTLATSFRTLGTSAAFATSKMTGATAAATTGSIVYANSTFGTLLALSPQQQAWAKNGMSVFGRQIMRPLRMDPYYDRGSYDIVGRHQRNRAELLRAQRDRRTYNRRLRMQQGVNMAGGLVGSAAIGYGMHKMTDDNDTWQDNAAGVMYGIAGTAAMVGGPWGWGIAAGAAIIGGIMQVIGSAQKSTKIYGEIQDFAKKNAIKSGVITGSESQTMQYLEAQKTSYTDINDLIQTRINLTAKLLGLQQGSDPTTASTGVYQDLMEKHDDMWRADNLKAFNSIYQDKFNTDKRLIAYNGSYYLTSADALKQTYVYQNGRGSYKISGINGEEALRVGNTTTNGLKSAFASMAATAEIMSPGGYYEKLVEGIRMNVTKLGLKGASVKDFNEYFSQISKANNPQYLTDLVGLTGIKDTDWDLNRMLRDEQTRIYMWSQLQALMLPMQEAFLNFRTELDSGKLTTSTLSNYLKNVIGGQAGLALKDYDPNNIAAWFSHYGYADGKFGSYTSTDKNGNVHVYSAEEAAKIAASDMQSIMDVIRQSGVEAQPAAKALMEFATALLTLSQAAIGSNEAISGQFDGEIKEVNGQKWKWNARTKSWELLSDDNKPAQISQGLVDLSNNMSTLLTTVQTVNAQWPIFQYPMSQPDSTQIPETQVPYKVEKTGSAGKFPFFAWNDWMTQGNKQTMWWMLDNKKGWSNVTTTQKTTGITMTPQQMGNAFAGTKALNKNIPGAGGDGTDRHPGTSTSDYGSNKKERAIPKQININIQNLMSVDSIDLTNENNVAIIDKIKREVAYALYEAAADGTMMLNNLATTAG